MKRGRVIEGAIEGAIGGEGGGRSGFCDEAGGATGMGLTAG